MSKEDKFSIKLRKISNLVREKKELEVKVGKLTAMVNRLLDHIINDKIMDSEPYVRLKESIREPVKGG